VSTSGCSTSSRTNDSGPETYATAIRPMTCTSNGARACLLNLGRVVGEHVDCGQDRAALG
jgi:hypothetical protein